MHIKLTNGIPESYSIGQLRRDNPQVSFPKSIPDSTLFEYDVYPLKATERPAFDSMTQRVEEGTPARQRTKNPDGTFKPDDPATPESEAWEWVQVWNLVALSADEVAQRQAEHAEQVRQQRAEAYRQESDPLFFKAQRGEATQQEWLAKVEEIKARFPK
jgi:hypothetical protein